MNTAMIHQSSRQGTAFPKPSEPPLPMAEWRRLHEARPASPLARLLAKVLGRG